MVAWAVVGSTVTLTTSITASRPLRSALKVVRSRSMEAATPMASSTGLRRVVSVVVAVLSSEAVSVVALGLLLVKYCSAAMPAMLATIRSVNGVMLMVLPTSALVAAET